MGFVIDICVWIDVEQGALAPADVAPPAIIRCFSRP
jgi:hypothetical protein